MTQVTDEQFLRVAIEESVLAAKRGEYPYGAVLVHRSEVVLRGHNTTYSTRDITAHAELSLIRRAGQGFAQRLLSESILYSSCEPCVMCCGAIYWAGIGRLVYGCSTELDADISRMPFAVPCRSILAFETGHAIEIRGPLLEAEAASVLREFWSEFLNQNEGCFGLRI